MKPHLVASVVLAVMLGFSLSVNATQLNYQPVNPNFGGNAINGSFLLGQASAQNDHRSSSGYKRPTTVERLLASFESRMLNQLFRDALDGTEGYLKTDDYEISVENIDGVLVLIVVDIATGEETVVEIGAVGEGG